MSDVNGSGKPEPSPKRSKKNGTASASSSNSFYEDSVKEESILDVFCDPDHPKKVQFQDVSAAAYKIKSGVMRTPCTVRRTIYDQLWALTYHNSYIDQLKAD